MCCPLPGNNCHYRQWKRHWRLYLCLWCVLRQHSYLFLYDTRKIDYNSYITISMYPLSLFVLRLHALETVKWVAQMSSVEVFFFLLPVLWLMTSNCAAIGNYKCAVTKHQSSPKFRGHNLTSQETSKANICPIWQLHKLVSLRATRGHQTLLRSLSQTWSATSEKKHFRLKCVPLF